MGSFYRSPVAAETVREESRDAPDRRHTDASEIVNFSIGQTLFEIFYDLPSVDEGLEFCRRAQVFEEISALLDVLDGPMRQLIVAHSVNYGRGRFPRPR